MYPNIDLKQTGQKLKCLIKNAGYDVKYIQQYLHLSCPQPIYRWFQGKILPSVDHLYSLSILLGVHMEELIVPKRQQAFIVEWTEINTVTKRLRCYYEQMKSAA